MLKGLDTSPGGALPDKIAVHRVRGKREILASYPLLSAFGTMCGQPEAAEDLAYFLAKPGISSRRPVLLLIAREMGLQTPRIEDLLGTVLLYEYDLAGLHTGMVTSNDRSGRTAVIAPSQLRSQIVAFASSWLVAHGAHVVMLSFAAGESGDPALPKISSNIPVRWAARVRSVPDFLPLAPTLDETMAQIGQRTRSNMRYFRRRAEKELGCVFIPEIEVDKAELLRFSRRSMYAVPDRVAAWRLRMLRELSQPMLMGLRDREGNLLSLIGGRRLGTSTELLWQMNRDGLPQHSVSLVLRNYLIEHEIARGAKRFYIEGGISHPIRHSFQRCDVVDVAVCKRSLRAAVILALAKRRIKPDNELATLLTDRSIEWKSTGRNLDRTATELGESA